MIEPLAGFGLYPRNVYVWFSKINNSQVITWFLDKMVAHLVLRIHELLYAEIGNIISEIISAREKAEYYEEVANNSQRSFTLIKNNNFRFFLHLT